MRHFPANHLISNQEEATRCQPTADSLPVRQETFTEAPSKLNCAPLTPVRGPEAPPARTGHPNIPLHWP